MPFCAITRSRRIDERSIVKVLGVDAGLDGAIALVGHGFLAVEDIPTMGSGRQRIVNGVALSDIINRWQPELAVIEKVHAYPKQGVSSAFRFGQALGTAEGVIAGCKIPIKYVSPAAWKRSYRLSSDKEEARMRAIQLFPHISDRLSRKKDHDRAEALLIAALHTDDR